MRDVTLPSGATLKVAAAPFAPAWDLYQALLSELKSVHVTKDMDMMTLFKELFCGSFTSKEVERCLWACFARCLYSGPTIEGKITKDTFEPLEARQDFIVVCTEVARENVLPFVNGLYAEYKTFMATIPGTQKSK